MATILIIDDDLELFSLLSAYLTAEGFTAVYAADGGRGLREAAKGGHEVVPIVKTKKR